MTENTPSVRRQISGAYSSSNGSLPLINQPGANRSRRSSWSDSKVIKESYICLCFFFFIIQKVWNVGEECVNYSDSRTLILKKLDNYYRKVKRQILSFQSLTTGLFPTHLDPTKKIAHVVENVFCAIAVWSLRQCYNKIDNDQGRSHELGQAAVKCMRGILHCWMKQAKKVDDFRKTRSNSFFSSNDEIKFRPKYSKANNHITMHCIQNLMCSMVVKSKELMKSDNCKFVQFQFIY